MTDLAWGQWNAFWHQHCNQHLKTTEQQQHTFRKEVKNIAKIVHLGCQKARAQRAGNVLSNMTRQRKAKAKEIDQEARLKERNQQNDIRTEHVQRHVWSLLANIPIARPYGRSCAPEVLVPRASLLLLL